MAELSDKYKKILSEIESHISNKEERKYVEKKITELSCIYLELLDRLTKMNNIKMVEIENTQTEIANKVARIQETVDSIKNDIYDFDGYDFEIVCPYCNYEFVSEFEGKNKKEIECPDCHNIIELDWNDDKSRKYEQLSDEDDEF